MKGRGSLVGYQELKTVLPCVCVLLRNMKSVQGDCFTFGKELSGAFGVSKCVKLLDPKCVGSASKKLWECPEIDVEME